jgi:hypothetical protein
MPTVNFATETMDADVKVKIAKRRFKIPSAKFRARDATEEEEKRKSKIIESKRWKPYKTRAIQRARDLKQSDDGRGEEGELDTWSEELSSRLSSRSIKRFKMVRTFNITTEHYNLVNGNWIFTTENSHGKEIVAEGAIYQAHKKTDIVAIHEIDGQPCHKYAECDFMFIQQNIFEFISRPGAYKTTFY